MRKFWTVFQFELSQQIKKKTWIITTILLCVFIAGITMAPLLLHKNEKTEVEKTDLAIILEDSTYSLEEISQFLSQYQLLPYEDKETLISDIEENPNLKGIIIESEHSYEMITQDKEMNDSLISQQMDALYQNYLLEKNDINPDTVSQIMQTPMESSFHVLGKDNSEGLFITYIFLFVIYMLVILFGTSVSNSVAKEKESRTMELLITSASPNQLIHGKVLAMATASIIQVALFAISFFATFYFVKESYPPEIFYLISSGVSGTILLLYTVFSILGYLLYLYIYAAMGSLVSKMEDISSAVSPIMTLFMAVFFFAIFAMTAPNSLLTIIASFIPFSSLFVMPIRLMLTTVPLWQVLISLLTLLLSALLIAKVAAIIYRKGTLNYGNRTKLSSLWKKNKNK